MSGDVNQPQPAYPLTRPADDKRFTVGLFIELCDVLEKHGYERPQGGDVVDLKLAVFAFLYGGTFDAAGDRRGRK